MNKQIDNAADLVVLKGFDQQDLYQRREKIFTRGISGFYQRIRLFSGWPLLAGYFLTPWLTWNDRQAVLFDLPARQFHIFGITAWPQELWLLGWLLIIAAFGLFTVTTMVGRVWCGYTCPQTVWTAIFMWIEQITEGQRHQRIRLDKAPWSFEKVRKRAAKHFLWLGWAGLTGIAFVGYFTPVRELSVSIVTLDIGGWSAFWVLFFAGATYVNAGWMREQVCIYMCPYARFQSAMFDKDTLIVSYNAARGEPRGSRKRKSMQQPASLKSEAQSLGDCIDCQLCVQVCPTGIDIRDGLQYECIGCAQCIDACDQVMEKMGYASRLIAYTTEHALNGGKTEWIRGRTIGYSAALLIMLIAFGIALLKRDLFAIDVIRARGELYQTLPDGSIRNDYQLKVMNKEQSALSFTLSAEVPQEYQTRATIELLSETSFTVPAGAVENLPLSLKSVSRGIPNFPVIVNLCETITGDCVDEQTRFLGPQADGAK